MVRLFLASHSFLYVITMTETKLGDIIDDSLIALDNYHLYGQDRNARRGGVALFVHNSLTVTH